MNASKDYYEVLGIRPTARLAEIELAFKGRRTQYHPDKYSTADAETLRWANEKMQEVNEAYAILGNSDKRARYDHGRQSSSHGRSSNSKSDSTKTKSHKQDIGPAPNLIDYLTALPLARQDAERFHVAPDIPSLKLQKALACRSHFATNPPSQICLLVDDTLFSGGAEGVVVTDKVISFKDLLMPSIEYIYTSGWNGQFDVIGQAVLRNGETCKTFSHISAHAVQLLVRRLNDYFAARRGWHEAKALMGDSNAQFFMSLSCYDALEEQLRWLTMAAENGHVNAQHNLGKFYATKDAQLAFHWLTKAAQQGSIIAQQALQSDLFRRFH